MKLSQLCRLICFLFAICPVSIVFAADPDVLFQSDDVLKLQIRAPFSTINRERDKEQEYQGSELSYLDENGVRHSFDVKLSVRGNNRLKKSICSYSQLWINFDKDEVAGSMFANQNKLKLVVQCRNNERYKSYIAKEQLAYEMFNSISDFSFQTRLAEVTYIDTDSNEKSWIHLAFFIEHQNNLAARLGMKTVKQNRVALGSLDQRQTNLVDVFMFMIANTDYSSIMSEEGSCCHNIKLLQDSDGTNFPIPYDFDGSGLVNASYAEPNPMLRISSVRQRLYRGFCQPESVVADTVNHFIMNEQAIQNLLSTSVLLDEVTIEREEDFLARFFSILQNESGIARRFVANCRG